MFQIKITKKMALSFLMAVLINMPSMVVFAQNNGGGQDPVYTLQHVKTFKVSGLSEIVDIEYGKLTGPIDSDTYGDLVVIGKPQMNRPEIAIVLEGIESDFQNPQVRNNLENVKEAKIGDFNGNNRNGIAFTAEFAGLQRLLAVVSDYDSNQPGMTYTLLSDHSPSALGAFDINDDGKDDVLVATNNDIFAFLDLIEASMPAQETNPTLTLPIQEIQDLKFSKTNIENEPLVYASNDSHVKYLAINSTGDLVDLTPNDVDSGNAVNDVADYDLNNVEDYIYFVNSSSRKAIVRNVKNSINHTVAEELVNFGNLNHDVDKIVAGSFNSSSDNLTDVALSFYGDNKLHVLMQDDMGMLVNLPNNENTLTFDLGRTETGYFYVVDIVKSDTNADGRDDIIVATIDGRIHIFEQRPDSPPPACCRCEAQLDGSNEIVCNEGKEVLCPEGYDGHKVCAGDQIQCCMAIFGVLDCRNSLGCKDVDCMPSPSCSDGAPTCGCDDFMAGCADGFIASCTGNHLQCCMANGGVVECGQVAPFCAGGNSTSTSSSSSSSSSSTGGFLQCPKYDSQDQAVCCDGTPATCTDGGTLHRIKTSLGDIPSCIFGDGINLEKLSCHTCSSTSGSCNNILPCMLDVDCCEGFICDTRGGMCVMSSTSSSSSTGGVCNDNGQKCVDNFPSCCDGSQISCPENFPIINCLDDPTGQAPTPRCCVIVGGMLDCSGAPTCGSGMTCNDNGQRCVDQAPECCDGSEISCPDGFSFISCSDDPINGATGPRCCNISNGGMVDCSGTPICGSGMTCNDRGQRCVDQAPECCDGSQISCPENFPIINCLDDPTGQAPTPRCCAIIGGMLECSGVPTCGMSSTSSSSSSTGGVCNEFGQTCHPNGVPRCCDDSPIMCGNEYPILTCGASSLDPVCCRVINGAVECPDPNMILAARPICGNGPACDGDPNWRYDIQDPVTVNLQGPIQQELADLDNDDILDLVQFNDTTLGISKGNGDGTFGNRTDFQIRSIGSIAIADFDDDGISDIVVQSGTNLKYLKSDGSLGLTDSNTTTLDLEDLRFIRAANLDGDNKMDLVAQSNNNPNALSFTLFIQNRGDGEFQIIKRIQNRENPGPSHLVVGDLNNDGLDDVALNYPAADSIAFIRNGENPLEARKHIGLSKGSGFTTAIADFNNDGNQDILSYNRNLRESVVVLGDGHGMFSAPVITVHDTFDPDVIERRSKEAFVGDANGDCFPDLFFVPSRFSFETKIPVYLGRGDGSFRFSRKLSRNINIGEAQDFEHPGPLAVGDLDNDGFDDLHLSGLDSLITKKYQVLLNTSNASERCDCGGLELLRLDPAIGAVGDDINVVVRNLPMGAMPVVKFGDVVAMVNGGGGNTDSVIKTISVEAPQGSGDVNVTVEVDDEVSNAKTFTYGVACAPACDSGVTTCGCEDKIAKCPDGFSESCAGSILQCCRLVGNTQECGTVAPSCVDPPRNTCTVDNNETSITCADGSIGICPTPTVPICTNGTPQCCEGSSCSSDAIQCGFTNGTLTDVSPNEGRGGDRASIQITGVDLKTVSKVFFGNLEARFDNSSGSSTSGGNGVDIRTYNVTVPMGAPGLVHVKVQFDDGTESDPGTDEVAFTFLEPLPELLSVTPDNGIEGQQIQLEVKNIPHDETGMAIVKFGNEVAMVIGGGGDTTSDIQTIVVLAPKGSDDVDVTVENQHGVSNAKKFTYNFANPNDVCRLDRLDDTNITRLAVFSEEDCLSQICDAHGPGNAAMGISSKCVYDGDVIKEYVGVPRIASLSPSTDKVNGLVTIQGNSLFTLNDMGAPDVSNLMVLFNLAGAHIADLMPVQGGGNNEFDQEITVYVPPGNRPGDLGVQIIRGMSQSNTAMFNLTDEPAVICSQESMNNVPRCTDETFTVGCSEGEFIGCLPNSYVAQCCKLVMGSRLDCTFPAPTCVPEVMITSATPSPVTIGESVVVRGHHLLNKEGNDPLAGVTVKVNNIDAQARLAAIGDDEDTLSVVIPPGLENLGAMSRLLISVENSLGRGTSSVAYSAEVGSFCQADGTPTCTNGEAPECSSNTVGMCSGDYAFFCCNPANNTCDPNVRPSCDPPEQAPEILSLLLGGRPKTVRANQQFWIRVEGDPDSITSVRFDAEDGTQVTGSIVRTWNGQYVRVSAPSTIPHGQNGSVRLLVGNSVSNDTANDDIQFAEADAVSLSSAEIQFQALVLSISKNFNNCVNVYNESNEVINTSGVICSGNTQATIALASLPDDIGGTNVKVCSITDSSVCSELATVTGTPSTPKPVIQNLHLGGNPKQVRANQLFWIRVAQSPESVTGVRFDVDGGDQLTGTIERTWGTNYVLVKAPATVPVGSNASVRLLADTEISDDTNLDNILFN